MRDFKDRTVYITGGSSGIGYAAATLLAAEGASVILFARTAEKLERAAKEISVHRRSEQQRFDWIQLDVSDRNAVPDVMKRAVERFGAPDLLINCAGRAVPHPFEEISYEQFDETMKINLYGIRNTVAALVPHMKEKGGAVVNVSSMAGFIGVFGYTDYAASKFAVIGFSEALRSELKPHGIRVSVLCPPDTETPGFEMENKTKPAETKAVSSSAKLLQPDDVARALIKGVKKGRFLIHCHVEGRVIHLAKSLFPSLVEWVMDRDIRKVQTGKKG